MHVVYVFSLLFSCVVASQDPPVMICREDKYDYCECNTGTDDENIAFLSIQCSNWQDLNTTNIFVPRRIFNTFDMIYIRLEIDGANITRIPSPAIHPQLASKLGTLIIANNIIREIESGAFDNLPMLKNLEISSCNLKDDIITSDWLTPKLGESLLSLNLRLNLLTRITSNQFNELAKINFLELSNSLIERIELEAFKNLRNLTMLSLDNNFLTEIPDALNYIPNLRDLTINSNKISLMPVLDQLRQLKFLDVSRNNIEQIHSDCFINLNDLSTLKLRYINLTEMPVDALKHLRKLGNLNLEGNKISEISSNEFDSLGNLLYLSLRSNPIQKIPPNTFNRLTSLKTIDLSNTGLTEIPFEALSQIKRLNLLKLGENNISELTKGSFHMINQIHSLDLGFNQIKKIKSHAFLGLGNLTTLQLYHNGIKYIENNAFDDLIELSELYLGMNRDITFADNAFGQYALENLETLDLSNCYLTNLSDTIFQNLPNLWTLKLIGNSFTSIPTTVRNIRQLYELRFIGNPISQLESNLFNGSKIRDLSLGGMANLTRIEDCAFCGLTVWSISLNENRNLKSIHKNAFGFANNSTNKTRKIKEIEIMDSSIKTLSRNLLEWSKLDSINIKHNPANCNPEMDWLFRNTDLKWVKGREDRCVSSYCKRRPDFTPCESTTTPKYSITTGEITTKASLAVRSTTNILAVICLFNTFF